MQGVDLQGSRVPVHEMPTVSACILLDLSRRFWKQCFFFFPLFNLVVGFDHKAHNCNKFTGVEKGSERNEWNRYTHYFERWKGHADANKYQGKLVAKSEQIMKQLTEKGD